MARRDQAKLPTFDKLMNFETVRAVLVRRPPLACPLVREPRSGQLAFIVDIEFATARPEAINEYVHTIHIEEY